MGHGNARLLEVLLDCQATRFALVESVATYQNNPMPQPAGFSIRPATREDVPLILGFIQALAEFENLTHEVTATEEELRTELFGAMPRAEVLLACENERPVGFALFFHNFSTFLSRTGLYVEDLFVLPEYRGKGYGRALMLQLAKVARERGCGRFEWTVLDWNQPAIDFYRSLGAEPMSQWIIQRVTGEALTKLASRPLFD
jgi:GNAT superfamily N-acetyltransferase